MNVVIDTNVVFSAKFFGGVPGKILELAFVGQYKVVTSEEIIAEYLELVGRYKKAKKLSDISTELKVVDTLISNAIVVDIKDTKAPPCADPDDIMFLQAAIASQANYLVSGDKHLLNVKQYPGGLVVKPQEFLGLI